jgi:hypothetical protein
MIGRDKIILPFNPLKPDDIQFVPQRKLPLKYKGFLVNVAHDIAIVLF